MGKPQNGATNSQTLAQLPRAAPARRRQQHACPDSVGNDMGKQTLAPRGKGLVFIPELTSITAWSSSFNLSGVKHQASIDGTHLRQQTRPPPWLHKMHFNILTFSTIPQWTLPDIRLAAISLRDELVVSPSSAIASVNPGQSPA